MSISAFALIMTCISFIIYERQKLRQNLLSEIQLLAQIIGSNCEAALMFNERVGVEEILSVLEAEPSIEFASVFDKNDKEFATYKRNNTQQMTSPIIENGHYKFTNNTLLVVNDISVNEKVIGKVFIQANLSQLHSLIKRVCINAVIALIGTVFLLYLISSRLQRIITEPILELANTAKRVSTHRDYSLEVTNKSNDEIGFLINAFNDMLAQIRNRQAALTSSEEKYRTLFNASGEAVLLAEDQKIIDCNLSALTTFGCIDRSELIGKNVSAIYPEKQPDGSTSQEFINKQISLTMKRGTSKFVCIQRKISGVEFSGEVSLTKMEVNNRIIRQAIVRDISDKIRADEELKQGMIAAENANNAKSEFLANMSHELRTPLHGILSFSSFGLKHYDAASPEKLLKYFQRIETSGKTLLDLLNDLLDLSKLEAKMTMFEFRPTAINNLIVSVIEEFHLLAEERSISIRFDDSNQSPKVHIDRMKISQVIRNLISNALKFSNDNTEISVMTRADRNTISVSVQDTGIGIPDNELDVIFNKFTQSTRTNSGAGGTGLGLAICKEIINGHDGTILASNTPKGTLITFNLPTNTS